MVFPGFTHATLVRTLHGQGMDLPSTAALDGEDLLIVNVQFQASDPRHPFDVVRVRAG